MRHVHHRRLAGAVLAVGALAFPAAASAHPGVFEVTAKIAPCTPSNTTDPANCTNERQYAVVNDGITGVWREVNGLTSKGLVNYKLLPTAVRTNLGTDKTTWLLPSIISDLQIHATCTGVAALESPANIVSWQSDPFYDYIPFQKASAGLGDDPTKWIPVVKTLTGVDLDTNADPALACTSLGGTFKTADTVVTSTTAVSSATIATAVNAATLPLNTQIGDLNTTVTGLNGQIGTLGGQLAALQAQKNAADASIVALNSQLAALKKPIQVQLVTTSLKNGAAVQVNGPPLSAVTVQLVTTSSKAKSLGLKSTLLGSATKTLDGTGSLRIAVSLSKSVAKALKGQKSVPVSVTALSAAKSNTVKASLR